MDEVKAMAGLTPTRPPALMVRVTLSVLAPFAYWKLGKLITPAVNILPTIGALVIRSAGVALTKLVTAEVPAVKSRSRFAFTSRA